MHNLHTKNTVRYYLLLAFLVIFLFFSNDFGLTDVQKTAIVVAVGIDKDEEDFVLTSQIAIPQRSRLAFLPLKFTSTLLRVSPFCSVSSLTSASLFSSSSMKMWLRLVMSLLVFSTL